MSFIYFTDIKNSYNIELIVFILLISCIFFNISSSFIIHLWRGHALNVNLFITIYTLNTKTSLSYSYILLLVIGCNIICIFKSCIFMFLCNYPIDLNYITLFLSYILISFKENYSLDLYSDTEITDTNALHDDTSESGGTENGGAGSGGPNSPNSDVVMCDRPDDSSGDDGSDNQSDDGSREESPPVIELPNNEDIIDYKSAKHTVS
jgi:hypothetical protein